MIVKQQYTRNHALVMQVPDVQCPSAEKACLAPDPTASPHEQPYRRLVNPFSFICYLEPVCLTRTCSTCTNLIQPLQPVYKFAPTVYLGVDVFVHFFKVYRSLFVPLFLLVIFPMLRVVHLGPAVVEAGALFRKVTGRSHR